MPPIDKHAPGIFCRVELGTTDRNAAKYFYGRGIGAVLADPQSALFALFQP